MKPGSRRKTRWWFPLVTIGAAIGGIAWMYETGVSLRAAYALLVGVATVALLSFWYVFLIQRDWREKGRAFLTVVAVGLLSGGILFGLFRDGGSSDGTAMPRLVFRFKKEQERNLRPLAYDASQPTETAQDHLDSPQFYGPLRTGVIPNVRLATDWETHRPKELWRRDVGSGWAGFAVAGNRAITQEQRGDTEAVVCYDLATGTPRWARENSVRFDESQGGNGPRATPTITGDRVFAMGATGIFDCLNLDDGEVLWSRNVLADTGGHVPTYGMAGSPLVEGNLVIVGGGGGDVPALVAYRVSDGGEVWRGGSGGCAYSSPMIADLAGSRMIVSVNGHGVAAFAIEDGREQWSFPWADRWPKSSQPVVVEGDRLLVSASYGMGAHLLQVRAGEEKCSVDEIWSSNRLKTKFSSAVVRDGFAYGIDEGTFACVGLDEGERQWKDGRYGFGQNLLVGDTLLIQAEDGDVVLVDASPEGFVERARVKALDGKTWNIPTLAAPYLLVRNDREAACYLLEAEISAAN